MPTKPTLFVRIHGNHNVFHGIRVAIASCTSQSRSPRTVAQASVRSNASVDSTLSCTGMLVRWLISIAGLADVAFSWIAIVLSLFVLDPEVPDDTSSALVTRVQDDRAHARNLLSLIGYAMVVNVAGATIYMISAISFRVFGTWSDAPHVVHEFDPLRSVPRNVCGACRRGSRCHELVDHRSF